MWLDRVLNPEPLALESDVLWHTYLVKTLVLQTASGHSKVHKGYPGAQVRREIHLKYHRQIFTTFILNYCYMNYR